MASHATFYVSPAPPNCKNAVAAVLGSAPHWVTEAVAVAVVAAVAAAVKIRPVCDHF